MKNSTFLLLLILATVSCTSPGDRLRVDISGVTVQNQTIRRYDRDLFQVDRNDLSAGLERLKPDYPFFLNTNLGDTLKLLAMRDYLENPRNMLFARACDSAFPNLNALEGELMEAFRHVRYYYPDVKVPRLYSYISSGDYEVPIQWVDSVMLIGLDCYLGKDFYLYKADQVPLYRVARTDRTYLVPDAMNALYSGLFPAGYAGNTLLDQMVEAGKRILFISAMLPEHPDHLKMSYTPAQYAWADKNEEHIWAAIIGNNMLYNTAGQTMRTFLADGPFTAEFSEASPPRLGEFIGWRILLQYLDRNPEVSLQEIIREKDSQKILTRSRYKPQK